MKSVMLITLVSMASSAFLYIIISYSTSENIAISGILTSMIIPMIIAPLISWYFIKLILEITSLEEQSKTAQEQLLIYEKTLCINKFIGNIAHQWRQPLSMISTLSTSMIVQKEHHNLTDKVFTKTCNSINDHTQFLSKIINDFEKHLSNDIIESTFLLKDEIEIFLNLIDITIKNYDINIVLDLQDNIKIISYKKELTQCLNNIFDNAKDVLIQKNIKNKYIFISTSIENKNAIIKIKDNAGGISEKVRHEMFEPYCTTKNKSFGTGLGLHITYSLIKDVMNGDIKGNDVNYKYNNIQYSGAEFTISLPMI